MRIGFSKFFSSQPRKLHTLRTLVPRNLILIGLEWFRDKDPRMGLAHASILANLRDKNVPVIERSYGVNKPGFSASSVTDFILKNVRGKTDVALGAYVWNEPYLQTILSQLRQNGFQGRIILGGPQISYVKSGIEDYYPNADVFIRGYAEEALARFMISSNDKPIIAGVHYANEPDLGLSAKVDFNDIPSPFLTGVIDPQTFIRIETQRGCPFRCSFCQHRESDSSQQRKHFAKSRIMREIAWITQHPIIKDVAILDPTFNSGPNYLDVLAEFSKQKYSGKLSLQARMEMVTPEFLDIVEELNKTGQTVLEFGLQTIHRDEQALIQRPNNMKKVGEVLKEVNKRNIPVEVSLIFGLPGQTVESFKKSIEYCKNLGVPTIYAFPLMLLRGTELFHKKRELHLVESSDLDIDGIDRLQQGIPHVVASDTFTFAEFQEMVAMASGLDDYNTEMTKNSKLNPLNKNSNSLREAWWGKTFIQRANGTNISPKI